MTCNSDLTAGDFNLNISGSGNITFNKKLEARQVKLQKTGSGTIKIKSLETDDADLSLSGSGNFEISGGKAKKQSIQLSGSGNVSAYGLKSIECIASITGSGNIDVSVDQTLEGKIAGSGNINYQGEAQVKKNRIIGSGRIYRKS